MRTITAQERSVLPPEAAPQAEAGTAETAGFCAASARRDTAARFTRCVADPASRALDCPLPGSGRTVERFAVRTSMAPENLCVARMDAAANPAELGPPPTRRSERWGVWAAEPPGEGLTATRSERGKQHGSVVTAKAGNGKRLLAVRTGVGMDAAAHGPGPLRDTRLGAVGVVRGQAAEAIGRDPSDAGGTARLRSLRVRAFVEWVCADVLTHVERATGAGSLCHDERPARNAADPAVHVRIRRHHAEPDLAEPGGLLAREASS